MVKTLRTSGALLLCAAICFTGQEAQAQVICAQNNAPAFGNIVYGTPAYGTPAQNYPCGCGSSGGCVANPGNCDLWVSPGQCVSSSSKVPIHVDPPKDCKGSTEHIAFYCEAKEQRCIAKIKVPKKIERTEETYKFERKTWNVCGCKVSVCVPCEIETTCSTQCEPACETVELIAKIRTRTGKADIWVENVIGLPSVAVLGLNLTSVEANGKFPGATFSY